MMNKIMIASILTGLSISIFADPVSSSGVVPSSVPVSSSGSQTSNALPTAFCPDISDIKSNPAKGNWVAKTKAGFWKSYHQSFATDLTQFVGAQWVGEKVGQVTCIYNSEQRFTMQGQQQIQQTLPVLLVFNTLSIHPSGGKWTHPKKGLHNCNSTQQSDCPFQVNVKPSEGNILQEAEALKDAPSNRPVVPTD